jgi:hypothetical protein
MRYLLITYLRKANGQIDEQVTVSASVKANDIQTCNVIIDYKEKKVEKCLIEGNVIPTDFDRLSAYYKNVYPAIIERLETEAGQ